VECSSGCQSASPLRGPLRWRQGNVSPAARNAFTTAVAELLAGVLGSIAVTLAGRAGSRLATSLSVPASRQVMLRLVMATPDPETVSPRVLGVDDFAIRRVI
jgi:hypothetical protein